jgi:acetyl/propionyl-CoA carboxylase alpha subunit/acetyl-CoA carboxylase carboxyltransferase component
MQEFKRVAIVNRGEAAMRFIHAAREFNQEQGTSLQTIALFAETDRHAMFVREADEAACLGSAWTIDPDTGQSRSCYVDYERLQRALSAVRADAVWVGWGFVAEHAAFADLCRDLGIVFIGPDGDVMRQLGDKISSKLLAEQAEIPVVPWSGEAVETIADARRHAEHLKFPLVIKPTAGSGGRGVRYVYSAAQLPAAFESARDEAFKAFGNPTVFMEQLLENARDIEVQIIADHYGKAWAVGVLDCGIRRDQRRIMEEAPSPVLSVAQDKDLREAAVRLSEAANYQNAGTVEFLYQPLTQRFSFVEMNTQLAMEHPVTECTSGIDLVKLQIHVARAGHLEGEVPAVTGHAIEVRLNAEDAEGGSASSRGRIERFGILTGPGVRVDTGVVEGDSIPAEFDSTIAKIIAHGRDRKEALSRLERTLRHSVVVVNGGSSNKAFLLDLLSGQAVRRAEGCEYTASSYADVALIASAIEAYDANLAIEQAQFYSSAARGRPQVQNAAGRVSLRYRGCCYSPRVRQLGPHQYGVEVDGFSVEVYIDRSSRFEYWLTGFGRRFHVVSVVQEANFLIEVDGVAHKIARDDGGVVHAPAPAVVVSISVKPGDTVSVGDRLVVLEAMKMEMEVLAPFSGKVRCVLTIPNVQVDTGAPLVQIDPAADRPMSSSEERIAFGASRVSFVDAEVPSGHCKRSLEDLRRFMLGFDLDPIRTARRLSEWSQKCPADSDEIRRAEEELFQIFVDNCSLFQRQPEVEDAIGAEGPSAEIHLFSYLRTIETGGAGLPPAFVEAIRRTLTHYNVQSLTRSPELEQSLLWIYKSHQRVEQQIPPIMILLERRLQHVETLAPHVDESLRILLDRMVAVTRESFPALSDLAREVRYRYFDQPLFDRARKEVYEHVENQLAYLDANPQAADRRKIVRALVECPQPLVSLFAGRFFNAAAASRQLMLEVLTWRYYRIRMLMDFHTSDVDGYSVTSADYDHEGRRIHLFTTHAEYAQLEDSARRLFPLIERVPAEHDIVLDFYVYQSGCLADPESTEQEVRSMLDQVKFPRPIRRIVVAIGSGIMNGHGMGGMQHFTYRSGNNTYEEDKLYRGLHPMIGKRLHLWRLNNFNIERLPSAEDVYLLRGVARDNPKDERLFACAEVRDLTPVRDATGRVVHLPHLERMFAEALAAIRVVQSRRKPHERLYWNRILLYVWPPFNLKPDELNDIVRKLVPSTEGLGLEQVVVRARIPNPETGELRDMIVRISTPGVSGLLITFRPATKLQPIRPLTEYDQKVVRMRQRGMIYPYEIIKMLTPAADDTRAEFPPGDFVEHDLDAEGRLVPVTRSYGQNKSNIIVGVIRNFTAEYPEGMTRVVLLGDPSKDLGALAESECRRIMAALDLAEEMRVPLEWFPVSAGAKISMTSGVENMDWIARVLRRLIEYTQAGGEVNLLVNGINVGAQPYWNAEATMLMHTRGILVMTPKAAMVLTGKRALEYSGSISAEDNQGIGGYDRIMGLNGQAQYFAHDINEACHILLRHYAHTYLAPGERFPRRAETLDPIDRDVRDYPHEGGDNGFSYAGEIFSDQSNPGRKKSFDIRKVMMAAVDQDHVPLERWSGMRAAETAVVWDAHLGGYPVCLIGIESRQVFRLGFVPADGPEQWTAGTLFPLSSKKIARAINAASNNRPVVLLANLSGFDGSPESMRRLQLEYGAEIGRAVVNFKGPMVFCVISRYHGGAYVVFSRALNEQLEVVALEGTYASVIGGSPAAAVVFTSEVDARARKDKRLQALTQAIAQAEGVEKGKLRTEFDELFKTIYSEKLGEVATEFDNVHSVQRALKVGALSGIIPPAALRPYLIQAIERAEKKESERTSETPEAAGPEEAIIAA